MLFILIINQTRAMLLKRICSPKISLVKVIGIT